MEITTNRLILKEMTMEHFQDLCEVFLDKENMKYYASSFSEETVRRWIEINQKRYQELGYGLLAVCLKSSGKCIGDCGLSIQKIRSKNCIEIGYHINAKYQRLGYSKEACDAIKVWAFANLHEDEIYSYMTKDNEASYWTAISNGMKRVDEYIEDNVSLIVCSITRSEFNAQFRFIRPNEAYLESFKEANKEDDDFRPDGERIFSSPESAIEKSYEYEHGINLPKGYVKATTFWYVKGNTFIGEINIRHELTPNLLRIGGHIGYEIRYSCWHKGYGKNMLKGILPYCKFVLHLDKVLITCDDNNFRSAGVIERNGGILQDKIINHLDFGDVLTRRYWVKL